MVNFFRHLSAWLSTLNVRPWSDERGATAVEYGVMVALIAAVIVGVVAILGTEIQEAFCAVANKVSSGSCTP